MSKKKETKKEEVKEEKKVVVEKKVEEKKVVKEEKKPVEKVVEKEEPKFIPYFIGGAKTKRQVIEERKVLINGKPHIKIIIDNGTTEIYSAEALSKMK